MYVLQANGIIWDTAHSIPVGMECVLEMKIGANAPMIVLDPVGVL